jgi:two-component system chemotaxis response regulator CheB
MIKTLIVDDSSLVREIIKDFLESDESFQVIGEAENGIDAIQKAKELSPDLITVDIEMPVMNGLEAIGEIKKILNTAIVVITTHDTAKMAFEATTMGAMEFFAKDIFTSESSDKKEYVFNALKHITNSVKNKESVQQQAVEHAEVTPREVKAVVIASSTGGPMALCQLFSALPAGFPVPILLVQHNTSGFDQGFAQWLDGYTQLKVSIAAEGAVPQKGNVYVAPTDKHLIITEKGIAFDDSDPVNSQKPAADLLFKSACQVYSSALVSVVLTGMGNDGAEGTMSVKQAGGITICQDESTSMIYGMPQAAAQTGCVDMILPLHEIASRLITLANGG